MQTRSKTYLPLPLLEKVEQNLVNPSSKKVEQNLVNPSSKKVEQNLVNPSSKKVEQKKRSNVDDDVLAQPFSKVDDDVLAQPFSKVDDDVLAQPFSKVDFSKVEEVDFDEASRAWKLNKKSTGNGCYKYICIKITKTGKQCKNDSLRNCEFCRFHNKKM